MYFWCNHHGYQPHYYYPPPQRPQVNLTYPPPPPPPPPPILVPSTTTTTTSRPSRPTPTPCPLYPCFPCYSARPYLTLHHIHQSRDQVQASRYPQQHRGIEGTSVNGNTNGGGSHSASSQHRHQQSQSSHQPMLVDGSSQATSTATGAGAGNLSHYAHLNGVIDQSIVAMMPDVKKIKVNDGDDAGGSGGSPASVTSSSGGGGITVVGGGATSTSSSNSSSSNSHSNHNSSHINSNPNIKSRVVHLRAIPPDMTASELYQLAAPFGAITKHLLIKGKGQAFVEFESSFAASQMASYWAQTVVNGVPTPLQPTVRGRHVHCQISNHKELNMKSYDGGLNNNNDYGVSTMDGRNGLGSASMNGNHDKDTTSIPSPVIRVIVDNLFYVVNLDSLHQIFSRAGKVLKIVTFTKNNIYQALVQYADTPSAIQAKLSLDGQCMFHSGNVLRIEYSKLTNLIVKYNNEKSRDYTQPGLGSGGNGGGGFNGNGDHRGGTSSLDGSESGGAGNSVSAAAAAAAAVSASDHFNSLLAAAGGVGALGPFGTGAFTANGSAAARGASGAAAHHHGYPTAASLQLGLGGLVNPAANAAAAAMFAATGPGLTGLVLSPVIHVSGLSTEHTTPDALFILFGVYGDVIRVKILFNKKDTALIQMAEPTQAHLAITNLDRTRLYGKTLRVNSSKHTMVQMPKEGHQPTRYYYGSNSNITVLSGSAASATSIGTPDSGLTKDYTNSPLHRFKRPGSKNFNNIYPPSETLHVSNIPQNTTEEELKRAFAEETGKEISKFKFFPNDRRMALVQFDCIENSILALIKMHNYKVAEHSHLRVSFSKSPV